MAPFSFLPSWLALPYFVVWASLLRALLVRANLAPPTCARCGLRFERSRIGEPVCSCSR
jgi:predicted Zn-ribbon and HTH transcriptional regulator